MKKEKFKPLAKTVQELFSKPNRWCRYSYAKDIDDIPLDDGRREGVAKFCLYGAMQHVYGCATPKYYKAVNKLVKVIETPNIASFNDGSDRTIRHIRQVVKKAGI
jgi:hypothetical protein